MKHLLICLFLFPVFIVAQSTDIYYTVITQKDTPVNSGFGGTIEPLHIVSINKQENSQVVRYTFDMRHELYAAYQKKQISADSLAYFQRKYLLDTVNLYKWEKQKELLVYIQLLKDKWKFVFDINYSGVFTDDPVYYKDTSYFTGKKMYTIPIQLHFWNEKEYTKELTFILMPDPALPKKDPEALFNTWGGTRKIRQGTLTLGIDSFLLKFYLADHNLLYTKNHCSFSVSNANENDFQLFSTSHPVYNWEDSVFIGNKIMMLDKVSILGDTIIFKQVGENEVLKGVQTGAMLKSVYGIHLSTGVFEDISLKRTDSKYTLLHFWGSWCGPCIANLPKLKVFANEMNDKVEFIGFPYEQQQDTVKTKKLIQQYQLNWKQIIQFRDHPFQKPDMVKQLAIEHFPTYMLIDNTGKILVRSSNLEDVMHVMK